MKQGVTKSITELMTELKTREAQNKDYLLPTKRIRLKSHVGGSILEVKDYDGNVLSLFMKDTAHQQMAAKLHIPTAYYYRMLNEDPELLDTNVNTWLGQGEEILLRTHKDEARAILSKRYRLLDNLEVLEKIYPVLQNMLSDDCHIESCNVTDTHMFLKVVSERLKGDIHVGDTVQAGFVISNSEVGRGSFRIEPMVFRLVCTNGLIAPFHMDGNHIKYHKGRKLYVYSESYEVNVDEIKTADNEPYFNQVRQELLNIANNNAYFTRQIEAMRRARDVLLSDVTAEALIKVIGKELLLTKTEQDVVKKHYLANADHSQYGLLNAVTRASQDIQDYNRATELERIGGDILFMNRNMMESIRLKAMGMK